MEKILTTPDMIHEIIKHIPISFLCNSILFVNTQFYSDIVVKGDIGKMMVYEIWLSRGVNAVKLLITKLNNAREKIHLLSFHR